MLEKEVGGRGVNISNSIYVFGKSVCNPLDDERSGAGRKGTTGAGGGEEKEERETRREGRRRLGRYTIWVSASVVGNVEGSSLGAAIATLWPPPPPQPS